MISISLFYWKIVIGFFFFFSECFLLCHALEAIGSIWLCEGCGVADGVQFLGAKERWRALGSLVPDRALSHPFPLVSRLFSGRTWHGKEVEERLVSWKLWSSWPLLTPPIVVLQRFGVIGSEREANLVYSVLFRGEELQTLLWVGAETGDLNPMFDQQLWLSCVERGPMLRCQHVGKSKLSEVAKMF